MEVFSFVLAASAAVVAVEEAKVVSVALLLARWPPKPTTLDDWNAIVDEDAQ